MTTGRRATSRHFDTLTAGSAGLEIDPMRKIALILAAAFFAASALAENVKLKVGQVLALQAGLAALDGYVKEVPQGKGPDGQDLPPKIIAGSYKLTAKTKWAVADNLTALKRIVESYAAAEIKTIKEVSPDGTGEAIDKSPALLAKYSDEIRKLRDVDVPGGVELILVTREDLNLDVNQNIPGSALTGLAPILKK